uniref:Pentatricopeptide repeat-containing protein n=1 Tax=Kalanchoe fedtschenkoi TaxID=63787 RepID=A0A7N1A7I2_KALFE
MMMMKTQSQNLVRKVIPSSPFSSSSVVKGSNFIETSLLSESDFISLIHSAGGCRQIKQIHARIIKQGMLSSSRIVTQLISATSLHNCADYSVLIFRQFSHPNSYIFNALIRGLADNSEFRSAILHFVDMLRLSVLPDRLTLPFVLKSAAGLSAGGVGRALHGCSVRRGLEFDDFVRVSLVDMYVKVEELKLAAKVFEESPEWIKNGHILLWNVLINGYCKGNDPKRGLELFEAMPERNLVSWNSLVDGFMRSGDFGKATELFDEMPEKNVVSWTTVITGYLHNEEYGKAISMFFRMLKEGVKPNDQTLVSTLAACARMGSLESGMWIHNYVSGNGFKLNRAIGTALIEMYSKCGVIELANKVFHMIKEKDLLTWTVMINGWALHGFHGQAIQYFDEMKSAGIRPDGIVFLSVITACCHSGQVDKGLEFFNSMVQNYSIIPTMKHYSAVVDLFCKAGRLVEALTVIKMMPMKPDLVIWGTLFSACTAQKNVEIAELASQNLLQCEPKHPGSYVFLSNFYAEIGRWDDAERVRLSMKDKDIEKDPGWSSMELQGQIRKFKADDLALC